MGLLPTIITFTAVAIGPVTGRPFPWLLVWGLVTYEHVTLVALR